MKYKYEVTITYTLWKDDHEEIQENHKEVLEAAAEERIALQLSEGYLSGQLICDVVDDTEKDISYTGWWSKTTKNIE